MARVSVPGFVDGSNTERSIQAQVGRTINLFVESTQPGGDVKAPKDLQSMPKVHPRLVWPEQPIRGLFNINGRAFAVGGTLFGEFFADNTIGTTHTVTNDDQPVSMCSNGTAGNQILIISGGDGYIYDTLADTFAAITDPDFPDPAKMGEFLNGYFLALQGGGSRSFSWSNLEDGTIWDPLDVAERSATADNLGAMIRSHEEIWFMGGQTTQVYVNTGVASEIWAPISGVVLEFGVVGPFTVHRCDNTLFWLQSSVDGWGMMSRADGYTPQRRSTFGVEQQLQQQVIPSDALAFTLQMNGHIWYVLLLPRSDRTWVYDVTMDVWFEWNLWDSTNAVWIPHVVNSHIFEFGTHYVGDRNSGAIYELSMQFYDDQIVDPT
jgi:hypothetical protein